MSFIAIGKKRWNIDQPLANVRKSVGGSGIMVLVQGTEFTNPSLDDDLSTHDGFPLVPALDDPVLEWT